MQFLLFQINVYTFPSSLFSQPRLFCSLVVLLELCCRAGIFVLSMTQFEPSFSHTDGLTLVYRGGHGPLKSSSLLHRADSWCEVLGFLITDKHLHSGVVVVPAVLWFFQIELALSSNPTKQVTPAQALIVLTWTLTPNTLLGFCSFSERCTIWPWGEFAGMCTSSVQQTGKTSAFTDVLTLSDNKFIQCSTWISSTGLLRLSEFPWKQ